MTAGRPGEQPLDTRAILASLRWNRAWWLVPLLLGLLGGLLTVLLTPTRYASYALVKFPVELTANQIDPLVQARSQAQVVKSLAVAAEIGQALNPPVSAEKAIKKYDVKVRGESLLRIDARAGTAQEAADLANQIADIYVRRATADRDTELGLRIQTYDAQLSSINQRIAEIDARLVEVAGIVETAEKNSAEWARGLSDRDQLNTARFEASRKVVDIENKRAEVELDSNLSEAFLRIEATAQPPAKPYQPKILLTMLLATVIGGFIGIVAAVAHDQFSPRIRRRAELARASGAPVIASLLGAPDRWQRAVRQAFAEPSGHAAPLVAGVVSRQPGVAVTVMFGLASDPAALIAGSELAAAFARQGRRVLLLDAARGRHRLERANLAAVPAGLEIRQVEVADVAPGQPVAIDSLIGQGAFDDVIVIHQVDPTFGVSLVTDRAVRCIVAATIGTASSQGLRSLTEHARLVGLTPTLAVAVNASRSDDSTGLDPDFDPVSVLTAAQLAPARRRPGLPTVSALPQQDRSMPPRTASVPPVVDLDPVTPTAWPLPVESEQQDAAASSPLRPDADVDADAASTNISSATITVPETPAARDRVLAQRTTEPVTMRLPDTGDVAAATSPGGPAYVRLDGRSVSPVSLSDASPLDPRTGGVNDVALERGVGVSDAVDEVASSGVSGSPVANPWLFGAPDADDPTVRTASEVPVVDEGSAVTAASPFLWTIAAEDLGAPAPDDDDDLPRRRAQDLLRRAEDQEPLAGVGEAAPWDQREVEADPWAHLRGLQTDDSSSSDAGDRIGHVGESTAPAATAPTWAERTPDAETIEESYSSSASSEDEFVSSADRLSAVFGYRPPTGSVPVIPTIDAVSTAVESVPVNPSSALPYGSDGDEPRSRRRSDRSGAAVTERRTVPAGLGSVLTLLDFDADLEDRPASWFRPAVAALTVLMAILALTGLGSRGLWMDEAFTASLVDRSWSSLAERLLNAEFNGALYSVVLWAVSRVSMSEWALRLPSVVFAVMAVPMFAVVARRLLGARAAIMSTVLWTISGAVLMQAQNARSYSLATLLVLVAAWFFIAEVEEPTATRLRLWSACSVLAVLAHLFAILPVVAMVASLFALPFERRRLPRRLIAFAVPALVAVASTALVASRDEGQGIMRLTLGKFRDVLYTYASRSGVTGVVVLGLLAVVGLVAAIRWFARHRVEDSWPVVLVVSWAVVPPALLMLMSILEPALIGRYLMPALPGFVMLCGIGGDALLKRLRSVLAIGVACVVVVLATGRGVAWQKTREAEDWKGAAAYLFTQARSDDLAVFANDSVRLFFEYYGDEERLGFTPSFPDPFFPADEWGEFEVGEPTYESPTSFDLEKAAAIPNRIWVIVGRNHDNVATLAAAEQFLSGSHPKQTRQQFSGDVEIVLYEVPG
jgi:capsular polysaccharide biosynthesis protein